MFRHTKIRIEPLTRRLVNEFQSMESSPGERPVQKRRLTRLRAAISEGRFYPPRWARVTINGGGPAKMLRMNGQHTAQVFSEMETLPVDVVNTPIRITRTFG